MAAIHGTSVYFWNISLLEETLKLQQILKGFFSSLTLTIGIALVVLGPFIMFANGIVIAAVWKDPYKQLRSSPSNIIIASMAVCDFLVGIASIVPSGTWFIAMSEKAKIGIFITPVTYTFAELLIVISVMHVVGLTIDRVLAVVNPLLYKSRVTRKRALLSVILVWINTTLLVIAQGQLQQYYYAYNVASAAFISIMVLVITCLCIAIIYKVRKQTKIMKNHQESIAIENRIITERDNKTTKSILLILLLFILCITWYSVSVIVLLSCSIRCYPRLDVIVTVYYLSLLLLHVNSLINPILYAFRVPKFRKSVTLILKKIKKGNFVVSKIANTSQAEHAGRTRKKTIKKETLHFRRGSKKT